jgi:hypothetical protein
MAFDQSPQLLGVASDATARTQEVAQKKQALTQEAIQNANAPIANIAQDLTEKQLDKITITPEMATGLSKMTGDDGWSRTAGTKWDPRIFTAMVGMQSKMQGRTEMEEFKRQAQADKESSAASLKDFEEKKQNQREHDREENERVITEMRDSTKHGESTPIKASMLRKFYGADSVPKEVGDNEDIPPALVKGVMTQKDDIGQFTKILNSLKNPLTGLPPDAIDQATKIFQSMKQQTGSSSTVPGPGGNAPGTPTPGGDAKRQQAIKILKDAGKPTTDANIKYVMDNQ